MRIVIVGGGIAGLSTYLHLRKHLSIASEHTITIYESHRSRAEATTTSVLNSVNQSVNLDTLSESTAIVGGGLCLSPNGMRVIRDLSLDLHDRVIAQGFPVEKFIFKGANGWTLGTQSTSDRSVRVIEEPEEVCIASSRQGLWHTLLQYVTEKHGADVIKYRKVLGIERDENRSKLRLRVHLLDEQGNEEVDETDLVIGADGVKSVVRKALFDDDQEYNPIYR